MGLDEEGSRRRYVIDAAFFLTLQSSVLARAVALNPVTMRRMHQHVNPPTPECLQENISISRHLAVRSAPPAWWRWAAACLCCHAALGCHCGHCALVSLME